MRGGLQGVLLGCAICLVGTGTAFAIGETATAKMKGADGKDLGTIEITETMAGVLLRVSLKGLPPGQHGFHWHVAGTCEGDFSSAGAIYNPFGAQHGLLNVEGPMAGDLTNVVATESGDVEAEIFSPLVTLSSATEDPLLDADGASLVIFENADDHTADPEGNAGARIACGVVGPPTENAPAP